jgi:prepilin-type N-terminal cleavage/methylation domain-containing protein
VVPARKQEKGENMMRHNTYRTAGFTLVEIMIVVAIIGLLAAIAIPNFVKARETAQTNACINNLRQIDGAKQQWALEAGKSSSDTPTWAEVGAYLKQGASIETSCPAKGTYTIGNVSENPRCSVPKHELK